MHIERDPNGLYRSVNDIVGAKVFEEETGALHPTLRQALALQMLEHWREEVALANAIIVDHPQRAAAAQAIKGVLTLMHSARMLELLMEGAPR